MLLPSEWDVPQVFRDRLGEKVGRQRAMEAEGHLLLVLHKVRTPGVAAREGVLFWRDPQGQWRCTGRGEGIGVLRRHVEEFAAAVDGLEDQFEKAGGATQYWRVLQAIGPLHRASKHLHTALQTAREAIPNDRDLITQRDRAGEVERAAELLHNDSINAMSYTLAVQSEDLARSSHQLAAAGHRINMLAAIFLPLMTVATLFGMNMSSGVEDYAPLAFWLIVAAGLVLGVQVRNAMAPKRRHSDVATRVPDAGAVS